MPTLANIQDEIATMLTALEDADDQGRAQEMTPALLTYLDELAIQEAEKVDAIAYADRKAENEIEYLKAEEGRLAARRRRLEARKASFRDYLLRLFVSRGLKKVSGHNATISLRKNSAALDVAIPVDDLPAEFVETVIERRIKRKELLEALKGGLEVPGVRLRQSESIAIR